MTTASVKHKRHRKTEEYKKNIVWAFAVPFAAKVMVRIKCKKKLETITVSDYQNKSTRENVKNSLSDSQIKH